MSMITAPAGSTLETLEAARAVLDGRRFAVLTGAGVSTDSGIPDYRGKGRNHRTPMTFGQFVADPAYRQRYWLGGHLGGAVFEKVQPNPGHTAIAAFEQHGLMTGLVTQNVDGLHRRAGSQHVVELHGALDQVVCLSCGHRFHRDRINQQIRALNPWINDSTSLEFRPDGDAAPFPTDIDRFVVPDCLVCGGLLKPDMVFFGEFVPVERFDRARKMVDTAEALLIAGSSLAVNSGVRLLEVARRRRMPVVVVNLGPSKADSRATVRIESGTSEALSWLAERLTA